MYRKIRRQRSMGQSLVLCHTLPGVRSTGPAADVAALSRRSTVVTLEGYTCNRPAKTGPASADVVDAMTGDSKPRTDVVGGRPSDNWPPTPVAMRLN